MTATRRTGSAVAVFAVTAAAGVFLSARVSFGQPILATRWSLFREIAVWTVVWGAGVVAALRLPARWAVGAIVAVGIALRLAALGGLPTTSDDLYRYSWDGRVQAAGIDAYRYAPNSAALAGFREPWLWPDAPGCQALHRPVGCTRINRSTERTIYPPLAEAWFAAAYRVGGIGSRYKTWQIAGLVTELAVLGLLPMALRRWRRDPRWVALYALSPVPVLEIVNNGHVDGLAVVAIVGAVAIAAGPPSLRRDALVGVLIGAAALIKFYPAVFLPMLVGPPGRRLAGIVRAGVVATVTVVVGYLPHLLAVGAHVLGYLPGYLREEHYDSGGRFLLPLLARVPSSLTAPAAALVLAAAVVWVVVRRPEVPAGAAMLVGALLISTSPVQPWYAVTLLAVATIAARPAWTAVVLAAYPYFFAIILDHPSQTGIGEAAYGSAVLVLVLAAAVHSVRPWLARPDQPISSTAPKDADPVIASSPVTTSTATELG